MLKPSRAVGDKLQGAHPGGNDAGSVVSIIDELLAVRRRINALIREREVEAKPQRPPVESLVSVDVFAAMRHVTKRTVVGWCKLGLEHEGKGAARRIVLPAGLTFDPVRALVQTRRTAH